MTWRRSGEIGLAFAAAEQRPADNTLSASEIVQRVALLEARMNTELAELVRRLGGTPVAAGEQARLLLLGERFRMGGALLVDRSLGLRGLEQLQARPAAGAGAPWLKAEYSDKDGKQWKELDLAQLVQDPAFLGVAT